MKGGDDKPGSRQLLPGEPAPGETLRGAEVVDDFVRNFLLRMGMERTLDVFEEEWYKLKSLGKIPDLGEVPDVYMQNQALDRRVREQNAELEAIKSVASKATGTWEKLRKVCGWIYGCMCVCMCVGGRCFVPRVVESSRVSGSAWKHCRATPVDGAARPALSSLPLLFWGRNGAGSVGLAPLTLPLLPRCARLAQERDFHRMNHRRVAQEKNRLITDIQRLKKHYSLYEPTLGEMRHKYESAMKEKMLTRLEKDRLAAKASEAGRRGGCDGSWGGVCHRRRPVLPRWPRAGGPRGAFVGRAQLGVDTDAGGCPGGPGQAAGERRRGPGGPSAGDHGAGHLGWCRGHHGHQQHPRRHLLLQEACRWGPAASWQPAKPLRIRCLPEDRGQGP